MTLCCDISRVEETARAVSHRQHHSHHNRPQVTKQTTARALGLPKLDHHDTSAVYRESGAKYPIRGRSLVPGVPPLRWRSNEVESVPCVRIRVRRSLTPNLGAIPRLIVDSIRAAIFVQSSAVKHFDFAKYSRSKLSAGSVGTFSSQTPKT